MYVSATVSFSHFSKRNYGITKVEFFIPARQTIRIIIRLRLALNIFFTFTFSLLILSFTIRFPASLVHFLFFSSHRSKRNIIKIETPPRHSKFPLPDLVYYPFEVGVIHTFLWDLGLMELKLAVLLEQNINKNQVPWSQQNLSSLINTIPKTCRNHEKIDHTNDKRYDQS